VKVRSGSGVPRRELSPRTVPLIFSNLLRTNKQSHPMGGTGYIGPEEIRESKERLGGPSPGTVPRTVPLKFSNLLRTNKQSHPMGGTGYIGPEEIRESKERLGGPRRELSPGQFH